MKMFFMNRWRFLIGLFIWSFGWLIWFWSIEFRAIGKWSSDLIEPSNNNLSVIGRDCTYSNCFDASKCAYEVPGYRLNRLRIYIYDLNVSNNCKNCNSNDETSLEFWKILNIIRSSEYFVDDPRKACVFVPNVDFLNGISNNKTWSKSINHLVQSDRLVFIDYLQ